MITVIFFSLFFVASGTTYSLEHEIARKYLNVTKNSINNRKENLYLNGLTTDASVRACHKNLKYHDLAGKIENASTVLIYDDKITHVELLQDANVISVKYYTVKIQTNGQIMLGNNLIHLKMDKQLPQFKGAFLRQNCEIPAHEVLLKIYKESVAQKTATIESSKPTASFFVDTTTTTITTTTAQLSSATDEPSSTTSGPSSTTSGPSSTTSGPSPTTAGPSLMTAGPSSTTSESRTTTSESRTTTSESRTTTSHEEGRGSTESEYDRIYRE